MSAPPPGSAAAEQRMREQVKELGRKFLARTAGQVATFREQLAKLASGDVGILTSMQEVAHKIHGSGAVFGFSQISECAARLEMLIQRDAQPGSAEWARKLTQSVEELAQALEAVRQT
jgi:HPt (histidine-containing phosphotransfer) domain-containing protein